jgi:type VI secretion system protein
VPVPARTLLERLATAGHDPEAHIAPAERLRRSVLRNLGRMLNARQGHARAQPDLGTPPPNELVQDYPASIPRLQQAIAESIRRYEPRLVGVRVTWLDKGDPLTIHFQIHAALNDGSRTPMQFSTAFDPSGRVRVGGT